MSLIPWRKPASPAPFGSFQQEMNRLFEDFFGNSLTMPAGGTWMPAISISDSPNTYTLRAELPGMSPDDVKINITHNLVVIEGERKEEKKEQNEQLLRHELNYGSFMRQIAMPTEINPDHSEATMDKGILTLKLPKVASSKSRTIKPK